MQDKHRKKDNKDDEKAMHSRKRSDGGHLGGWCLRLPLLPSLRAGGVVRIQFFRVFAVQRDFLFLGCQVATFIVAMVGLWLGLEDGAADGAVDGLFDQFLEGSHAG